MATPFLPRDDFEKWQREIQAQIDAGSKRDPFINTAFTVPAPGVTSVSGTLDSANYAAGSTGWALTADGNAEFNSLTLRGGIIGNDALTSPTSPLTPYDYTSNFAVTTTLTNLWTQTIPVPTGFTKAAVTLTVRIYAINNTAGLDYLYSQANINGYNGLALPVAASASNGSCMNVSIFGAVLTGTALGSNLVLQAAGQTAFGTWAANASNQLDMSATVTWYR